MVEAMTVGELIARLHEFDESLPVRWDGDRSTEPVAYAELPEHERHVLLTNVAYAGGEDMP